MKRCESGNLSLTNKTRVLSKISVKRNLSIIPSKTQTSVLPFLEKPAQTCTFTGCFGLHRNNKTVIIQVHQFTRIYMYMYMYTYLGLGLGAWPTFRQQNLRCVSSWTVASSVQMISSKLSSLCCSLHCRRFTLFSSLIS